MEKKDNMKCNVCGREYTSPSLGGPGICGSCDCGVNPFTGEHYDIYDSAFIAQRMQKNTTPYFIKDWNKVESPTL